MTFAAKKISIRPSVSVWLIAGLYILGLFLNASWLLPWVDEINYWDEIVYVASGKDLFDYHALWPYPRGPLVSFIYAAIYGFLPDTEYWLMAANAAGRVLAYTLFFINVWLVGRELQLRGLVPAVVLLGLFTAMPYYSNIINNPSYWTFALFAGLALWLMLVFARSQKLIVLVGAAGMVGLALLARPDVVFGVSAALAAIAVTRPWRFLLATRIGAVMLAVPTVFSLIYIGIFGLQTGVYQFGGGSKFYDTFASSYQVFFDEDELAKMQDFEAAAKAREMSAQAFGSREENGDSVLRAISRNPTRFALMVWNNTYKRTGPSLLEAYGPRLRPDNRLLAERPVRYLALIVLFFSVFGLIELCWRREWVLLAVVVMWPLDIALYLITISFSDYFALHFLIVLLLSAVGLWAAPARFSGRYGLALWAVVLFAVVVLGWNPPGWRGLSLAVGGTFLLAIMWWRRDQLSERRPLVAGIVIAGLMAVNLPDYYRLSWPGPDSRYLAQAKYLKDHFPPTTPTLAYPGIAVVSAKMWWIGAWSDLAKVASEEDFLAMMRLVGTPLIVTDPLLPAHNIYGLGDAVAKYADRYYRVGWRSPDGHFSVLIPKDLSKSKVIMRQAPLAVPRQRRGSL